MKSRRHLYISTPVHSGEVPCEYAVALHQTVCALLQNGIAYTHNFIMGNALVHDARNRCVAWFLESDATDLLFIDGDLGWEPQAALRLAISPHDVIGGAYPQKRDDAELYNAAGLRPSPSGLIEVDYLGAGFLKISRKAIEKLIKAAPETRYQDLDGRPCYGLFQSPIGDGKIVGEDAWFCRKWRETGGKVFLDPNMTFWHVGRKAWRGNFGELAARVQAEKAAERAAERAA